MIYIIGHTKPDLDSAVAAVALKELSDKVEFFGFKNAKAVLADEPNHETVTIFAQFNYPMLPVLKTEDIKPDDRFILVDHNETQQRLEGIKNEQIINIFDHHKFTISLNMPISIIAQPWGSTNTIIYWLMQKTNTKPSKALAGIMLCAILSDTVGLKSATTTPIDKKYSQELQKLAGVNDIKKLTFTIFKAKSNLSGLSTNQVLTKDYKIFEFGGQKVFINQVETVEQNKVIAKSQEYIQGIMKLKDEMSLKRAYCVITDILNINSKCLCSPEDEELLSLALPNAKSIKDGVYDLGPVMSRKKEIAPAIEKAVIENS
jgi:manganese-dependent inorganic pyrophosphatase